MSRIAARIVLGSAIAVGVGSSPASAQDALGSGNALDNNLNTQSNGVNRVASTPDFRARNLVVTGDVPGGRGFRDTVGYRAAGDFAGELGSDDLFGFRSDSALSSPNVIRYGRTSEQIRFGQDLASLAFRRDAAPSLRSEMIAGGNTYSTSPLVDRIRLDWVAQAATSSELAIDAATPRSVGFQYGESGEKEYVIDVSSLLGVVRTPITEGLPPAELTLYEQLRLREDEASGRETEPAGSPFRLNLEAMSGQIVEPERIGDPAFPGAADPLGDPRSSESYERIVKRIAERFAAGRNMTWSAEPTLLKDLQTEFDRIQEKLQGARSEVGADEPVGDVDVMTDENGDDVEAQPGDEIGAPVPIFTLPGEGETPADAASEPEERDLSSFGIVLRHGEQVDRLVSDDQGLFNELMQGAEQRLRAGEYFWAERRFMRALRFVPGHPLATAGLGHAQIGAGLYASASLTLQSLFTFQPEMIDVRYDDGLLPSSVRIQRALEELRERVRQENDPPSAGFLLAYIGHQLDDRALVTEGLDVMGTGTEDEQPLLELLRSVWLDGDDAGDDQ